MARIEKTITIQAPVEKVFAYISNPANLPVIWPSLVMVTDIHVAPGVGDTFKWVYKMAGMRFEGISETLEYVPNQRIVTRNRTGIPSSFWWTFQPEGSNTHVTLEVEYTVPTLAEAFIIKLNEHEAEVMLANLKTRLEN